MQGQQYLMPTPRTFTRFREFPGRLLRLERRVFPGRHRLRPLPLVL